MTIDFEAASAALPVELGGGDAPVDAPDAVYDVDAVDEAVETESENILDEDDSFEGSDDSNEDDGVDSDEDSDEDEGTEDEDREPSGRKWQQYRRLEKRLKRGQRDHQLKVDKFSSEQDEFERYMRETCRSPKKFLDEYSRRSGMSKKELFGKWAAEGVDSMDGGPRTEAEYQEQARQKHEQGLQRQQQQQVQVQQAQFRKLVDGHATAALEIATEERFAERWGNIAELRDDQIYNKVGLEIGRSIQNGNTKTFEQCLDSLDKQLETEYQEREARHARGGRGRKQRSVNSAEGTGRPRKEARSISGADAGGGGVTSFTAPRDRFAKAGLAIPDF